MGTTQLHTWTTQLKEWADNTVEENYILLFLCVSTTLLAGIMSGLTLGLMSLDTTQMEVLIRSGSPSERKYARRIMPVIKNTHWLLVTLLLCNAFAMSALPLFLDRLADPVTALVVSVTAVLFFGEVVPQALCARYGLLIGARLAWFVRLLMSLTSPLSWTLGQLLDLVLGKTHGSLFRRQQLKALVDVHGEATGLGGKLTLDEIKVITGALDLTHKIAYRSMTPLDSVVMLSSEDKLDAATLAAVLASGHSRIPVHRGWERSDLVGLLLVKELLQYKGRGDVPVAALKLRSLPRLPANTPMYDCLKLFQTGRSHMAVLTQPDPGSDADSDDDATPPPDSDNNNNTAINNTDNQGEDTQVVASLHVSEPAGPQQQGGLTQEPHGAGQQVPTSSAAPESAGEGSSVARRGSSTGQGLAHTISASQRSVSFIQAQIRGGRAADDLQGGQAGEEGEGQGVAERLQRVGAGGLQPQLEEFKVEYEETDYGDGEGMEASRAASELGDDSTSDSSDRHRRRARRHRTRVPRLANPGEPIGILTIEDVIEELIRAEVVDETDLFVDNEKHIRVEQAALAAGLPERLKQVMASVDKVLWHSNLNLGKSGRPSLGMSHSLTAPLLSPSAAAGDA